MQTSGTPQANTVPNASVNCPARSRIRNQLAGALLQIHQRVPCLLNRPHTVRVRVGFQNGA
jgi:hypothetical protein